MSSGPMNEPGQAQMLLIRRYARAMRELQSEAIKARAPRTEAGEPRPAVAPESLIAAAQSLVAEPPSPGASA
jgi:hypothetical protein